MARIFVSYSRADRQFIDQLIPLIQRIYGNDSVWYDDDIHGGVDWWQMILDEIAKCDLFIYLISNESLESPYCQAELREALRLNKQILPVIVRRLKPPYPGNITGDLANILSKTQFVDMSGGFRNENNNVRLWGAINRLLEAARTADSAPATFTPTPEPSVPDKKKPDSTLREAYIGGAFLLLSVIIAGIFGLWQGVFANQDDSSSTLSRFQELQTIQVQQTRAVASPDFAQLSTALVQEETDTLLTETAAGTTLLALSDTPISTATNMPTSTLTATATQWTDTPAQTPTITPTPNATATLIAFRPQTNADWTPIEQDFDGVTMVLVPAGCFDMGSTDEQIDYAVNELGANREWMGDEQPVDEICFDEPFWIDKYEITNEQYGSVGCSSTSSEPDQPRNCVDWFEARDFCEAREARLPTEAEWEYAARGVESWVYPWGDDFVADNVVYSSNSGRQIALVGSRPDGASWVGALDMSGNVWERTSSIYVEYPYDESDGREDGTDENARRVLRGGGFHVTSHLVRGANRTGGNGSYNVGFRCVRPPSQ